MLGQGFLSLVLVLLSNAYFSGSDILRFLFGCCPCHVPWVGVYSALWFEAYAVVGDVLPTQYVQ